MVFKTGLAIEFTANTRKSDMGPGILLSLCVVVLSGPLKDKKGTAVDYKEQIYTAAYLGKIKQFLGKLKKKYMR